MNIEERVELVATLGALINLCMAKGVFTEEEFNAVKNRAVAEIDQVQAKVREEYMKTEEGKALAFLESIIGDPFTTGKR